MRLRLLWVDDEAYFINRGGKQENWPNIMLDLLRKDSVPDEDTGIFSTSAGLPASFADIRFAPSFSKGLKLIGSCTFDIAILDMRLKSEGAEHEAVNSYLRSKGLQLFEDSNVERYCEVCNNKLQGPPAPKSRRMEYEMALAFWLWRELVEQSPNTLAFFYTYYGDSSETFVYQPFMNPDPTKEMTPAIHVKNADSLTHTIQRFLDSRALQTLMSLSPSLLTELAEGLRSHSKGEALKALLERNCITPLDNSYQQGKLADLFPALALAASSGYGGAINRHKQKAIELLERAVGQHQQCAVLARLTAPRNLDWDSRPTYGIRLVKDFSWGKNITAWPVSVGYSPLEMLSHGVVSRDNVTTEDLNGWSEAKQISRSQIEDLTGYIRDNNALSTLREWSDYCNSLKTPLRDPVSKEILNFKDAFRWTPKVVLETLVSPDRDNWTILNECSNSIAGYKPSISDGIGFFIDDLKDNSGVNVGFIASDGSKRPRTCWMAIGGIPTNERPWPYVASQGNKLPTGLRLLQGYLICYQFRLNENGAEWRCLNEEQGEHLYVNERKEAERHIANWSERKEGMVGYVFVLPEYPSTK